MCPDSPHAGRSALTYRLVAMVNHVGSSVNCGHYTAVARSSGGQLYHFDDSNVRPVSSPSLPDANAYIIIYEAEREATAHNGNSNGMKPVPKVVPSTYQEASTSSVPRPMFNFVSKPTPPVHKHLPLVIPMHNKPAVISATNGKTHATVPTTFSHKFIPSIVEQAKRASAAALNVPAARVPSGFQPRINGLVPYDDEDSNGSDGSPAEKKSMPSLNGSPVAAAGKATNGGAWRVKDATGAGWAVSEDKSNENSGSENNELEDGEIEPTTKDKTENKLKRK